MNGTANDPGFGEYELSPANVSIIGNIVAAFKTLGGIYVLNCGGLSKLNISNNTLTEDGSTAPGIINLVTNTITDFVCCGNIATSPSATKIKYDSTTAPTGRNVSGNNWQMANAVPTTGEWKQGDVLWKINPTSPGAPGWICVVSGSPGGTWAAMPNI